MEQTILPAIKTYVLRIGRMTDAQRKHYETLKPRWCIPFSDTPAAPVDFFPNKNSVTIEIGFGMGTVTAELAARYPDRNFIGIEVHKPGVGKLLGLIRENRLENIRIIEHDAIGVLTHMIPDRSVAAFHIFFPDPWPKKRHRKRRMIQAAHTALFAQKLQPGGYVYFVTDWPEYAAEALCVFEQTPGLTNTYGGFAPRQDWRPKTKFEEKGIRAGRPIAEILCVADEAFRP